ncbi:MAG: hypothetical protein HYU77_04260 [Betaproteobacteria bacterium]|nr:hypothetical protein [Betaproteobacteria bacterium]
MDKPGRVLMQLLAFALFGLGVGYFSASPAYRHIEPGQALLRVSFTHGGQIVGECRKLSAAELAAKPPNLRAPEACPRERSPVTIRVEVDGSLLFEETLQPGGLARDGASTLHRRVPLEAGRHAIHAKLNDSVKIRGFSYERMENVELKPGQALTIDFIRERGGLVFL